MITIHSKVNEIKANIAKLIFKELLDFVVVIFQQFSVGNAKKSEKCSFYLHPLVYGMPFPNSLIIFHRAMNARNSKGLPAFIVKRAIFP